MVEGFLPFRSLRGRLMLLAGFATLPAFLFVIYVAAKQRVDSLHRAEVESRYVADLASREHAQQVLGARRLLTRLAALPIANRKDLSKLTAVLPTILNGFPQFANLGVLTLDGRVAFSVVPPPHPVNMFNIPAFQRALHSQGVAVGTYLVGLIVERPILIMAKALRNAQGQPREVLFAALDLAWLNRITREAGLPPESALLIVDRNGTILASSLDNKLDQVPHKHLDGFERLTRNTGNLTDCRTPDGVMRLAVATPLKGTHDVWVVVGPPRDKVYATANGIFYRDLAVLALLALFAIGSSLVVTEFSVLRDLRLLAGATRKFGKGDLAARAAVPWPHGEIRDLAIAFNNMAKTLEQRHHQAVAAQERLRALSHRLETAREEEAARIAQELHDELGQALSVLRLELESVRRVALSDKGEPGKQELLSMIDELGQQIDAAVQSVRRLSSELRPGVLDRLGLEAGLEWLLNEFERRAGITTRFTTEGVCEQVDPERSTALFRIMQEALTNVARHANATVVRAQLTQADDNLVLEVKDNGQGFNVDAPQRRPSLGLLGMQERARRLGGQLDLRSEPGAGVRLRAIIPLSPQSQPPKGDL